MVFKKRYLFVLVSLLLFCALDANAATNNDKLDLLFASYKASIASWIVISQRAANYLFFSLALITLVIRGTKLILSGNASLESFAAEMIRLFLMLGFWLWILNNGVNIVWSIVASFNQLGMQMGNGYTGEFGFSGSPQALVDQGFGVFDHVQNSFGLGVVLNIPSSLMLVACTVLVLIVLVAVAVNLFITWLSAYIAVYAGFFFLGFAANEHTRYIAVNYVKYALSIGVQLMALQIIIGIGMGMLNSIASSMTTGTPRISEAGVLLIVSVSLFLLSSKIPPMLGDLVSGQSFSRSGLGNMSGGGMVGGMVAAGAVATGVGAAAVGGAATLGGLAKAAKAGAAAMSKNNVSKGVSGITGAISSGTSSMGGAGGGTSAMGGAGGGTSSMGGAGGGTSSMGGAGGGTSSMGGAGRGTSSMGGAGGGTSSMGGAGGGTSSMGGAGGGTSSMGGAGGGTSAMGGAGGGTSSMGGAGGGTSAMDGAGRGTSSMSGAGGHTSAGKESENRPQLKNGAALLVDSIAKEFGRSFNDKMNNSIGGRIAQRINDALDQASNNQENTLSQAAFDGSVKTSSMGGAGGGTSAMGGAGRGTSSMGGAGGGTSSMGGAGGGTSSMGGAGGGTSSMGGAGGGTSSMGGAGGGTSSMDDLVQSALHDMNDNQTIYAPHEYDRSDMYEAKMEDYTADELQKSRIMDEQKEESIKDLKTKSRIDKLRSKIIQGRAYTKDQNK